MHDPKLQALPKMVLTFIVNIAEDGMIVNHKFTENSFGIYCQSLS